MGEYRTAAEATHRGRTILKHVEKTRAELAQRFKTDPNLQWASSFTDRGYGRGCYRAGSRPEEARTRQMDASNAGTLILDADVRCKIGRSVPVSGKMVTTSKLRVVLRKEPSVLGYYIKTAFPRP